jgi:ACS family glucarate transporter-like MFS transporter
MLSTRFLLGIGEAVVYPASNRVVASWVPSGERGIANGVIFAGVGAGAGIAPPLITYIMVHHGWRWSFWISALIGLAVGVVWVWVARNTPKEHPWIDATEAAYIEAGLPRSATGEAKPLPWSSIIGNRNVLKITFSYFTYGYVAYIFFSWLFMYLNKVRGLDLKSSSYYSMLPFLAMAMCSPLGGWVSDRIAGVYGKKAGRAGVACFGMALAAVFVALGTRAQDARLATIILAGGAGALYLSQSAFWSVSSDIAGKSAGSVSGVMNMGNQFGGWLTSWVTPLIAKHFGWGTSFLVAAGLCLLGSLTWLVVKPEQEIRSGVEDHELAAASAK